MAAPEKSQLVEQHLSLVQALARKVKRTLGTSRAIDLEDLVAYGSKGLVEAAERFDARQGVAFSTFAYYRIRGAMYDGLRTMGWYSRADYARYRAEERANEYLRSQADREGGAVRGRRGPAGADAHARCFGGALKRLLAALARSASLRLRLDVPNRRRAPRGGG